MQIKDAIFVLVGLTVLGGTAVRLASAGPRSPIQGRAGTQPTYFVEHPEHIQLGLPNHGRWMNLTNPFAGDQRRIDEGSKLFIAYNCLDCHGAEGAGAMGPSLQDGRWHFGGSAPQLFQSIYEGRPDGMPAWGGRISDEDIWRLVSYVQTLSKGHDVATENFTGRTVARSGH